jgi:hypothetical protein
MKRKEIVQKIVDRFEGGMLKSKRLAVRGAKGGCRGRRMVTGGSAGLGSRIHDPR